MKLLASLCIVSACGLLSGCSQIAAMQPDKLSSASDSDLRMAVDASRRGVWLGKWDTSLGYECALRQELAARAGSAAWSESDRNSVIAGRVRVGMTKPMVAIAWGEPRDKSYTSASSGTWEDWHWGTPSSEIYRYVLFQNERVIAVEYN